MHAYVRHPIPGAGKVGIDEIEGEALGNHAGKGDVARKVEHAGLEIGVHIIISLLPQTEIGPAVFR